MREVVTNPNLCPQCGATFEHFLRWSVYRSGRFYRGPPWAVICRACKEIVGYEPMAHSRSTRSLMSPGTEISAGKRRLTFFSWLAAGWRLYGKRMGWL